MSPDLVTSPELFAIAQRGLPTPAARPAHVVVLGAGMAGLVAALELKRAGHRVTVIEGSHRAGGRVRTLRDAFSTGQYNEAGAMRLPAQHRLVLSYIHRYGLKVRPFTSSNPNAYAFFHRKRLRLGAAMAQSHLLGFELGYDEHMPFSQLWSQTLSPIQALMESGEPEVVRALQRRLQSTSLHDFLASSGWSEGAIEMYGLFAGFETLLFSAAFEFIREFVLGLREHTLTIDGGMDQLPLAIALELSDDIHYGTVVTALDQDQDGVIVHVKGLGGRRTVRADYGVCTIPLSVLRHIEVEKPFSRAKQRAIRNIHYEAACKIFFECRERFWEKGDGIYGGSSVTDLAIRNIYYPEHGLETGRGVLIGSYSHGQDAHRWGALPPHERLQQALENVTEIHPAFPEHVVSGASVVWSQEEFAGGAYAFFQPHQEAQLHAAICAPEGRYFFAGEHASLQHRWVQGAVESALRAAQAIHERTAAQSYEVRAMPPETPVLITEREVRERFANDFGGIHRHLPAAVVRPRSIEEVAQAVRYARREGLKIAARGVGHSAGGQSQVAGGLVIDMTTMDRVLSIDTARGVFTAQAGVRWRQLMEALIPLGYTPPVVTDWLHLTLGGTIIAGGVGAQSFRRGIQADLVERLTVVTGDGAVLTCSATENAELFDATRGGLGQYGIIVEASLRIEPAPQRVTLDHLVYDDLAAFIGDVERLMGCDAVDGLLAHAVGNTLPLISHSVAVDLRARGLRASPAEGRWVFDLEVFRHHDADGPGALPEGLRHIEALSDRAEWDYGEIIHRVPPIVERDARQGSAPHPELALFVPHEEAASFIGQVLAETEVEDMGGGPVLIIPLRRAPLSAPFFRVPDAEGCWLFGLLRAAPDAERVARLTATNVELYQQARKIGAYRYPVDGVPAPTGAEGWADHFGPIWGRAQRLKRLYDPDHLLAPALGIFDASGD